jgi:hypothetical protein
MENRRIEAIMYMKFNNNDKRGALLQANKKGVVVVDKPFKEVLKQVVIESAHIVEVAPIVTHTEEVEITLLWQSQIHANYLKQRGGKQND